MNLFITIVAALMLGDAIFILANFSNLESFISRIFPNLNLKMMAIVEGIVGLFILFLKFKTGTLR